MAEEKNTEKQRIRQVLADLGQFYPKQAVTRMGSRIAQVISANEADNPEAGKMLDELLKTLQKSKTQKITSSLPDMPAGHGTTKSASLAKTEARIANLAGEKPVVPTAAPKAANPVVK